MLSVFLASVSFSHSSFVGIRLPAFAVSAIAASHEKCCSPAEGHSTISVISPSGYSAVAGDTFILVSCPSTFRISSRHPVESTLKLASSSSGMGSRDSVGAVVSVPITRAIASLVAIVVLSKRLLRPCDQRTRPRRSSAS